MNRRLLLLAVSLIGVAVSLSAAATAAQASSTTTQLTGLNVVRPVFQQNGFRPFKSTYVRCYSSRQWNRETEGKTTIMGFYRGGAWIHVASSACGNADKALRGQTNATNVVALSTVLHETIHRQGVHNEANTECLAHWMTAHVVKARTGSERRALDALGVSAAFAKRNLPARYQMSNGACGRLAARWGIQEISQPPAPPPPAPTPPPPPPAPTPPPPPAVVFDNTYTHERNATPLFPPVVTVYGARRIEVSFSAAEGGGGWWTCLECSVTDTSRPGERRFAGFGVLRPGQSTSITIDNLSRAAAIVLLSPIAQYEVPALPQYGLLYPGPITIRIVGYR